jgi:rhodanese-related sulfurtransferase/rubrerythrin
LKRMPEALTCSADIVRDITPEEVWDSIRGKEEYTLVDVRTQAEYEAEHLPGARFIPLNELDRRYPELERQKKIITYCRSGRRSLGGAILLCNHEFKELYNMRGGIMNWPYETVKGPPEEAQEFFKEIREIKELLLFALQMEKASKTFYHKAAESLEEEELIDLLKRLSQAEGKHMELLYTELKEVWPQAPPLQGMKESEFMEGAISFPQSLLAVEEEPLKEKIDVLELALEKECKAYDLYQRMADTVEPPLREFFRNLAKQERGHIDELSRLL